MEDVPDYGNKLVERDGKKVLLIKSPLGYPDLVNDVEEALTRLHSERLSGVEKAYLVGEKSKLNLDLRLLKVLVNRRIREEKKCIERLRRELGELESKVFKMDKADKHWRFAYRVPLLKEHQKYLERFKLPPSCTIVYVFDNQAYKRMVKEEYLDLVKKCTPKNALLRVKEKLLRSEYKLIPIDGFDLAGERKGYPSRLLAKYYEDVDAPVIKRMSELVEELNGDVVLLLSWGFTEDARRLALGSKVELLPLDKVETLAL